MIGIHPDTGFGWLKRGKDQASTWKPGDEVTVHMRFARVFERAVASFSKQQLQVIEAAAQSRAPNTWQAAAWLLERRDPSNWGRRDQTEITTGKDSPVIQFNQVVLTDGDAREASRALLRRVAGSGTDEPIGIGMGDELTSDPDAGDESVIVDSRTAR